jgi:hypothetical protein
LQVGTNEEKEMANFTTVAFVEDDLTLPDIESRLNDAQRRFRASVLAISLCTKFPPKRYTCFTLVEVEVPAGAIVLQEIVDEQIPVLPNKTLVCIGECYVAGQALTVAALR